MQWGMEAENFFDYVVEEGEVLEMFVLEGSVAYDAFLLFVEFFTVMSERGRGNVHVFGFCAEVEHGPS